jgi:hypothetical protein
MRSPVNALDRCCPVWRRVSCLEPLIRIFRARRAAWLLRFKTAQTPGMALDGRQRVVQGMKWSEVCFEHGITAVLARVNIETLATFHDVADIATQEVD